MEDLTRGKSEPEGGSVFIVCRIPLVVYLTLGLGLVFHVASRIQAQNPNTMLRPSTVLQFIILTYERKS
jgi:hypothetical protein